MSFFTRTLGRLRREDGGFSLMETVVALGVLFVALVALAHTAAIGFSDIALSRQRTQANQIANKLLEQVRGLSYQRVSQGLDTADISTDTNLVTCPPDSVLYYGSCPSGNPTAEKVIHTPGATANAPLVPHTRTYGRSDGYTTTFVASVYVTEAKSVPQTGAFRVTALVTWSKTARPGLTGEVTTQSLIYTPEGTTDATTGGGTSPFFYGTGSISRAPVTITPNPGVTGGTGVTGFSTWESMTEDLYGLETSVQQQQLTRAESKAVMTGARKVVAGVETTAGGVSAEATADNDPATPPVQDSSPASLMQSAVSSSLSGGGNSLNVVAASGAPAICPPMSGVKWLSGVETGSLNGEMPNVSNGFFPHGGMFTTGGTSGASADSTVKRSGNYSLKVVATSTSSGYGAYSTASTSSSVVVHFALRFASLPGADVPSVMSVNNLSPSGTRDVVLRYHASSQKLGLGFQDGSNPAVGVVDGPVITAGTWYVIDLKIDWSTNPHVVDWMVDGVSQPRTTNAQAATTMNRVQFGNQFTSVFTANFDDMIVSWNLADYPIPDAPVKILSPSALGTSVNPSHFQNNDNSALGASTAGRLDDVPANSTSDYVKQVTSNSSSYLEVGFQDPPAADTCIGGVRGIFSVHAAGSQGHNSKGVIMSGSTQTCLWFASPCNVKTGSTTMVSFSDQIVPSSAPWTNQQLTDVVARWGYATDVNPNPYLDSIHLEYYAVPLGTGSEDEPAGTETGSTAASTAANAGTPCGNPTQLDGRACAYAREDYSTAGPPHLSARLDLTGSGAGKAKIYKFQPSTQAGSTSYVYGRRTAGGGGAGTVKETAVRYPGKHEFGSLPTVMTTLPANWPGYWVKYDAGNSASSVSAEAGVGSSPPTITSAGTISYYDQSCPPTPCVRTMTPPTNGQSASIPVPAFSHEANGFRLEMTASLASSPSFTSQVPIGASGTADRTEAKAVIGSPISGTLTYKLTSVGTGAVLVDLTIAVDLGSVSATARYAP